MTAIIAPEWIAAEQHNSSDECRALLGTTRIVPFFYRSGYEVQDTVYADGKKRYVLRNAHCKRCGGAGKSDRWAFTGYVCYECNGTGNPHKVVEPVYNAEQLAKLNARQDALRAKKQAAADAAKAAALEAFEAAHADLIAKLAQLESPSRFITDIFEKGRKFGSISTAQAQAVSEAIDRELARKAAGAASSYVGQKGQRIEFTGTVTFVTHFEGSFGVTYITGLTDEAGNVIIQKGVHIGTKGQRLHVKATVKEHGIRDGVRQTIITRPKVTGA